MEDNDFMEAMEGVQKLPQTTVDIGKQANNRDLIEKRRHAEAFVDAEQAGLSLFNKQRFLPHDIVGYKQPGVQEGVFRQFRLGKYGFDARLDLHGLSVEAAAHAVNQFIRDALSYDLRTVLIVHGKGDREGKEKKALLKNYTIQWVSEMQPVLAYHSARPQDGGAGALYVLLKKSERAKQKSREQFR